MNKILLYFFGVSQKKTGQRIIIKNVKEKSATKMRLSDDNRIN